MQLDRIIAVRNSKTIYCDENKCYKVFNADHSKADVLNEALNQSRLEETGLNVPKLLEFKTIDGKCALVSEYIEGKSFSRLMKEQPEKTDEYLSLFVDVQLEIHKSSCPLLPKLNEKLKRGIGKLELSPSVRSELFRRIEEIPQRLALCHGDFFPSNVIMDKSKTPFVIDWSHAALGDPSADAAITFLLLSLNGTDETAGKYLDLFSKKADVSKGTVRQWLPVVAAFKASGGNERERKFYNSWI